MSKNQVQIFSIRHLQLPFSRIWVCLITSLNHYLCMKQFQTMQKCQKKPSIVAAAFQWDVEPSFWLFKPSLFCLLVFLLQLGQSMQFHIINQELWSLTWYSQSWFHWLCCTLHGNSRTSFNKIQSLQEEVSSM